MYEVQDGKWTINYDPKDRRKPVAEWLKPQGRFKHLFKPENANLLEEFQKRIDMEWQRLLDLDGKRL